MRTLFLIANLLGPSLAFGQMVSPTRSGGGGINGTLGSTDNAMVRADGTTGDTFQTTGITVDDNNDIQMVNLGGLNWGSNQLYGTAATDQLFLHFVDDITLISNSGQILFRPEGESTPPFLGIGEGIQINTKSAPSTPGITQGVVWGKAVDSTSSGDYAHPMWSDNRGAHNLLSWSAAKRPCRAATTANITLVGAQTIDGVSVVAGDFVLVKDQSTPSENGPYLVRTGTWYRQEDFSNATDNHIEAGLTIYVQEGTANAQKTFTLTTTGTITIGSTSLTFTELP